MTASLPDLTRRPASQRSTISQRSADAKALGAVFTRPWVVDMILDLAQYTPETDLGASLAIEPACGDGAFVVPMAKRLLTAADKYGRPVSTLTDALRAYDLDATAISSTRGRVVQLLRDAGVHSSTARRLASTWVRQADFLLDIAADGRAAWVLGNPPYLRIEDIDPDTLARYRERWSAMSGRADVYVGFLEAGLQHLAKDGTMAVICADRWMRNQYGARLRQIISEKLSITSSLVLHEVDAFEEQVAAYPAVVVVRNQDQGPALVAEATDTFDSVHAGRLVAAARRGPGPIVAGDGYRASWSPSWFTGSDSWPAGTPERLAMIADLERRFTPLGKHDGIHLSVGVATGADDIFLRPAASPGNIESSRLLPYVAARDLTSESGSTRLLVNPWSERGQLASLEEFPGMAAYLRRHSGRLRDRYVARKNPKSWWRTIDFVDADLVNKPKLLLPDLKSRIEPTLDVTRYPGHSLYYLVSNDWDLEVLGGLLISDVASAFIEAYSVRMANGYLRVSAQYLRRISLPDYRGIDQITRGELARAFADSDRERASSAARSAYSLA